MDASREPRSPSVAATSAAQQQQLSPAANNGVSSNDVNNAPPTSPSQQQQQDVPAASLIHSDHLLALETQELVPGAKLTATNYIELLLGYLIQQRFTEAKYCWMRARERHPRDQFLRTIWELFGRPMFNGNIGMALQAMNVINVSQLNQKTHIYLGELRARLIATQLYSVQLTYQSLSLDNLADQLSLNLAAQSDQLQISALLESCAWPVDVQRFVHPNNGESFQNYLASLVDQSYGELSIICNKSAKKTLSSDSEVNGSNAIDAGRADNLLQFDSEHLLKQQPALRALADYSAFFDRHTFVTTVAQHRRQQKQRREGSN